jgi:hypothetical protein
MIKGRWIVAAVAVGLVALHVGPLLFTHPEQDACSFGDVSNAQYGSLLSRASIGSWRPFVWNDDGVSAQLNAKYHELVPNSASAAEKIAAGHAVMRALGGSLQRFDDLRSPNPDAKVQRVFVYRYLIDINRLFYFAPVFRQVEATFRVDNPLSPRQSAEAEGDPPIAAHLPNILEGFYHFQRNLGESSCPPVPKT